MKLLSSLLSLCLVGCTALEIVYDGFKYTGPEELEAARIINGTVFGPNEENFYLEGIGRLIIHNETDGNIHYDITGLAQRENLDSETAMGTYLIRAAAAAGGLITAKSWPPREAKGENQW